MFAKSPIDHVRYHVHCTNRHRLKTTRSRMRKPRREEIPCKEKNRIDENLRNSSKKFQLKEERKVDNRENTKKRKDRKRRRV